MKIFLNGREEDIGKEMTIEELLVCHNLKPSDVVVELNRTIVSKEMLGQVMIKENDSLEILRFVGGG